MHIADLLARDLSHRIEEIIKVDQTDEDSVFAEISEYVATDRIKESFRRLLKEIAEAPSEPHEGVGVWISGFFGSGKSSFAKNLGYVLANETVKGTPSGELFSGQVSDQRISEYIRFINAAIPTDVVMFDVQVNRAARRSTEPLAEVMYTVLLRHLGYAEDFDIAELEIELEGEGHLEDFEALCGSRFGPWATVRKGAQKLSRASAVLHDMDPATYPAPDSWAHSVKDKRADITVGRLVARTFELSSRRRPGRALVFIIDEVGQYVARSEEKIENLRAIVEQFGRESKTRLKARQAIAPVWVVVTSQEKLDEVVAAIDSRRVELAKLQDRFRHRVDLAPSDIREVATKRVLAKRPGAVAVLEKLYTDHEGQLSVACRLERTSRTSRCSREEFVEFYPYLPHYVDLSIDIMSGIRLQPGAPRQLGGSNRTIIKQAYEMLVSERTALAQQPLGALVTLDRVFDLVEGSLTSEKQKDVSDIAVRFAETAQGMPLRVAKTICLLEFVRDLPRTEANIAACLVDQVAQAAPLAAVTQALELLQEAQFIRNTEEGWKLQTAQEKSWEAERRGHLSPRPRDRNDIVRETLASIFSDPKLRQYRYGDLRTFRVGASVNAQRVGDEAQIVVSLSTVEEPSALVAAVDALRTESRLDTHAGDIYWALSLTREIDDIVANLHASRQMVSKYDQLRAQGKITHEEAACLQDERTEALRLEPRLRDKIREALVAGTTLFRGIARDGSDLGKTDGEVLRALLDLAIPQLYPKIDMSPRSLTGSEADELLKAADLKALPPVFYDGEGGLQLVIRDGNRLAINTSAPVAAEVLGYLSHEHSYGNRDTRTGKALESRFGGIGYGWDRELVRLALAALFRAGAIEVTYQGSQFRSFQDPAARTPFATTPAFRASLFSPRQTVDLRTLAQAVEVLEDLTGSEVDVEETAIAATFQALVRDELEDSHPLLAAARAHRLPVLPLLEEYQATLRAILSSAPEDCVRTIVAAGAEFGQTRERVRRLRDGLDEAALAAVQDARTVLGHVWPQLRVHDTDQALAQEVASLEEALASQDIVERLNVLVSATREILAPFRARYLDTATRREEAYDHAIAEIKNRPEWETILQDDGDLAQTIIGPLEARRGGQDERAEVIEGRGWTTVSLKALESDLAAVGSLRAAALVRLQELALAQQPQATVRRVRITDIIDRPLQTEADVDEALQQLRDALQKLVDEGSTIIIE